MRIQRVIAVGIALTAAALVTQTASASADTAPLTLNLPGVITVTTPPAGAALTPPSSLPGSATGSDGMVITANTAYHVTVKADNDKMRPWSGSAYTGGTALAGSMSLTPTATLGSPTLTAITLTTSDQTIISTSGLLANTYTFNFAQPVAATDSSGLYRALLTYTVSSGL